MAMEEVTHAEHKEAWKPKRSQEHTVASKTNAELSPAELESVSVSVLQKYLLCHKMICLCCDGI